MNKLLRAVGLVILITSFGSAAHGGVISGTVKGPDGAAFRGAFVRAQSAKTKITVNVLSDRNGTYRIDDWRSRSGRIQKAFGTVPGSYAAQPQRTFAWLCLEPRPGEVPQKPALWRLDRC